jgi:hypothetical protein
MAKIPPNYVENIGSIFKGAHEKFKRLKELKKKAEDIVKMNQEVKIHKKLSLDIKVEDKKTEFDRIASRFGQSHRESVMIEKLNFKMEEYMVELNKKLDRVDSSPINAKNEKKGNEWNVNSKSHGKSKFPTSEKENGWDISDEEGRMNNKLEESFTKIGVITDSGSSDTEEEGKARIGTLGLSGKKTTAKKKPKLKLACKTDTARVRDDDTFEILVTSNRPLEETKQRKQVKTKKLVKNKNK